MPSPNKVAEKACVRASAIKSHVRPRSRRQAGLARCNLVHGGFKTPQPTPPPRPHRLGPSGPAPGYNPVNGNFYGKVQRSYSTFQK
jgi:hypothetical protein